MDEKKNRWGTSIGGAFDGEIPLQVQRTGAAYYYGQDGQHATYDVTAVDEGTLTINGEVSYVQDGKEAYQQCREKGIDLFSGWSKRP